MHKYTKMVFVVSYLVALFASPAFATETENVRFRIIKAPKSARVDFESDVGLITGDPSGAASVERIYWSNKATALMSDRPTQAGVEPRLWGKVKVE